MPRQRVHFMRSSNWPDTSASLRPQWPHLSSFIICKASKSARLARLSRERGGLGWLAGMLCRFSAWCWCYRTDSRRPPPLPIRAATFYSALRYSASFPIHPTTCSAQLSSAPSTSSNALRQSSFTTSGGLPGSRHGTRLHWVRGTVGGRVGGVGAGVEHAEVSRHRLSQIIHDGLIIAF